jgi:hypothetical protein
MWYGFGFHPTRFTAYGDRFTTADVYRLDGAASAPVLLTRILYDIFCARPGAISKRAKLPAQWAGNDSAYV